jgi:Cdc6-like AAA superfamily ATPase
MWDKTKRTAGSKGSQYIKQLFLGSDPDVVAVVSQLERAISVEKSLLTTLINKNTAVTRDNTTILKSDTTQIIAHSYAIETQIHDLSREIRETTICLEFDLAQLERSVHAMNEGISGELATAMANAEEKAKERQLVAEAKADIRQAVADGKADKRYAAAEEKADGRALYVIATLKDEVQKIGEYVHQNQDGTRSSIPQDRATAKNKDLSEKLKAILKPETAALNALQDKYSQERTPDTCEWLLAENAFLSWFERQPKHPVLLVSGESGCGKTILSSMVIERLKDKVKSHDMNQTCSVAFFFCRKSSKNLSSVLTMLRTLAAQISETDTHYSKMIGVKTRLDAVKDATDASQLMKDLFVDYFKNNPTCSAYLIIDGIDECVDKDGKSEDFAKILQVCLSAGRWALPNLQLLLSIGRPEGTAADIVAPGNAASLAVSLGESAATIVVDADRVESDLDLFVEKRLNEDWKDCVITEVLRKQVRSTIKNHCRGDFRRASLILDEVTSLSREDDVWARLSRPPKDLDAATSLIVRKIRRGLDAHGLEDLIVSLRKRTACVR